jgi:hypothetical protein
MTINTDDLTIKQARELAAQFCGTPIAAPPADTSGSGDGYGDGSGYGDAV